MQLGNPMHHLLWRMGSLKQAFFMTIGSMQEIMKAMDKYRYLHECY